MGFLLNYVLPVLRDTADTLVVHGKAIGVHLSEDWANLNKQLGCAFLGLNEMPRETAVPEVMPGRLRVWSSEGRKVVFSYALNGGVRGLDARYRQALRLVLDR